MQAVSAQDKAWDAFRATAETLRHLFCRVADFGLPSRAADVLDSWSRAGSAIAGAADGVRAAAVAVESAADAVRKSVAP